MGHFDQLRDAFTTEWACERPDPLNTAVIEQLRVIGSRQEYRVRTSNGFVSSWSCSRFAGCDLVVITSHVLVREDLRGKGIGTFLRRLRERAYRRAGFRRELCTVRNDNNAQLGVMKKMNAKPITEMLSDLGGNVSIYMTELA